MKINKKVIKIAGCIRRLRNPKKYKSLGFLCDYLGDGVTLNRKAKAMINTIISQICTRDSWYCPKGSICYIAHEEDIVNVINKGCEILITNKDFVEYPCMISDNPLEVYAKLCKYYRDLQNKVSITGVTGSIGKSTVKNMIGSVYSTQYKTTYTETNANTKTTVGFAVQHIPNWAEKMIQEVHEGEPNETQYISEMLHPNVFVITAIDKSHLEFFGTPERIVEEVCSVTKYMEPSGKVIVNIDEFDRFELLIGRTIVKVSTQDTNADFYCENINIDENGLSFYVVIKSKNERYLVRLHNMFAIHNVSCALYAFAAGYCEGVEPNNIIKGLAKYRTKGVRQNVLRSNDGVLVYADCFNAVARSMKSAIDACDLIPIKGKRIAVLGDVEEAGEMSELMHREIIGYVNASKFDILLAKGSKIKKAIEATDIRDSLKVECCDSVDELSKLVKKQSCCGDLVLFKSSHSGNLDKCIVKVWPELRDEVVGNTEAAYNEWKKECLFY